MFDVTIEMKVKGADSDTGFAAEYTASYHNMGYATLQKLQRAQAEMLLSLGDAKLPDAKKSAA